MPCPTSTLCPTLQSTCQFPAFPPYFSGSTPLLAREGTSQGVRASMQTLEHSHTRTQTLRCPDSHWNRGRRKALLGSMSLTASSCHEGYNQLPSQVYMPARITAPGSHSQSRYAAAVALAIVARAVEYLGGLVTAWGRSRDSHCMDGCPCA